MIPIYINLCEYLSQKLADMKYIDLFNNQYDTAEKEHPFNMPSVFIQFMPIVDWITNSDGSQTGTLKIQFHLVTTCYSDTANAHKMSAIDKQMSFKHLQFVELSHTFLQNYAPVCCTNLQRTAYFPDSEHNQIYATIVEYECMFTDNSTAESIIKETVEVTPDLKVERPIDRPVETINEFPTPEPFQI